ncbi:MAG TPA: uroporphyrinogen decarboxylase family protein, partial [Armatimonadota bacterium]|nr:uroporphyrinogen decarboxylase family protein [Armatimonadota bacterium]
IQEQIANVEANPPQKAEDSCWEVFRHVVKERKDTHWINTCIGGMGFPITGPTDEIRYMNMALHPELLGPVAELQAKQCMATLEWYAEEGADSVMPCADLGSSTELFGNPRILEEHVEHWWKAYNDKAHSLGLKVIKHCCGHIWEALPAMIRSGFDGYEGVQASGGMDMKELKEKYGSQFTFWGGIWHEHLILGSAEEIDEDARYSIGHGAPGGGFIYGSSHSLAVGCKPENLEMMKDARARYGTYPIDVTG